MPLASLAAWLGELGGRLDELVQSGGNGLVAAGDVGYLSRLRRPDGNGTFILLTGIRPVGSHGINYLRRELTDLYERVDLQPFSTLAWFARRRGVQTLALLSSP